MSRTEELSDFQRGTIIGCYLSKKSVREISTLLEMPRATVNDVITKWERLGITTPLPRSSRTHKPSNRDVQVLEQVANKNELSSVTELTTEFQTTSTKSVGAKAVRRELQSLGFHGQMDSSKPKVMKCSANTVSNPAIQASNTTEYTGSSNEGVFKESQGHTDVQTSSKPADLSMDEEVSISSHSVAQALS